MTSGSFVRPARKYDEPRSFTEALKAKYASEGFEDSSVHIAFVVDKGALKKDPLARINQPIRISGKEVEEVGFDKIRKQLAQLSELKIVILDGMRIERSAARLRHGVTEWDVGLNDVREACPKAVELDLSRNLFEEWREVASICEQLNKLKSLRVEYVTILLQIEYNHDTNANSGSRFRDTTLTEAEQARCLKAFASITSLKLEEDLLPWEDVSHLRNHSLSLLTVYQSFVA